MIHHTGRWLSFSRRRAAAAPHRRLQNMAVSIGFFRPGRDLAPAFACPVAGGICSGSADGSAMYTLQSACDPGAREGPHRARLCSQIASSDSRGELTVSGAGASPGQPRGARTCFKDRSPGARNFSSVRSPNEHGRAGPGAVGHLADRFFVKATGLKPIRGSGPRLIRVQM